MEVYDKAHELAALLKGSAEYRDYSALRDRVERDENDRSMLEAYRKLRFELQGVYLSGQTPDEEKLERLNKLGEVLQFNPDISALIAAEYRLNRLVSDVYRIIGEAADIDVNFLKE